MKFVRKAMISMLKKEEKKRVDLDPRKDVDLFMIQCKIKAN